MRIKKTAFKRKARMLFFCEKFIIKKQICKDGLLSYINERIV